LAWPHRSLDAVAEAMGADTAERLRLRLKCLADETPYWPVDRHDLVGYGRGAGRAERHPELSSEAVEAMVWGFSYGYR
jgi:hypothetical protein